ncbi:PH domain-containing protein [Nocardioides marinquilinus]|uniref:PH domain-containing protein n=1 Tax=Nocardioides marinquilinus TaxID=1210400 RepID=A0ABP9PY89_9ACTN
MPAGSDATGQPALPRTWRPLGPRIAGAVAGGALLVITAMLWIGFDDETRASVTPFQRGTVIAMYLLGFSLLYALARSRVVARREGLVVVNGYRRREYAWAQVVAVHLGRGAPWVTLDLADGTSAPAMGIQGSDGARARQAVRQLRALVDDPPA